MVGLYDAGGLTPIDQYFSDVPAPHTTSYGSPSAGAIMLGSNGYTFPSSPTEDDFIHWDLNSPNLSNDSQWQGISSLSYRITGQYIWTSQPIWVEAVLHVLKPDQTESYYSDFIFHGIPIGSNGYWQTHSVDVASLGMDPGTIILDVDLRIFFYANSSHEGYVLVDQVVPIP